MSAITTFETLHSYGEPRWYDRFDPDFYRPAARWEWERREFAPERVKRKISAIKLKSASTAVSSDSNTSKIISVRGRLIGADKTELDEAETRAFLEFVEKAKQKTSAYRYRV